MSGMRGEEEEQPARRRAGRSISLLLSEKKGRWEERTHRAVLSPRLSRS